MLIDEAIDFLEKLVKMRVGDLQERKAAFGIISYLRKIFEVIDTAIG